MSIGVIRLACISAVLAAAAVTMVEAPKAGPDAGTFLAERYAVERPVAIAPAVLGCPGSAADDCTARTPVSVPTGAGLVRAAATGTVLR